MGLDVPITDFELLKRCVRLVHPELSAPDKAVLCVLASHFNNEKGYAFPSISTIQLESGCGKQHTVIKAINHLVALGIISKKRMFSQNTRYFFDVDRLVSTAEKDSTAEKGNHSTVHLGNCSTAEKGNLQKENTKTDYKNNLTSADADVCPSAQPTDATPPPHEFVLSPDSSPEVAKKERIPPCPYQRVVDSYNEILGDLLPGVRFITDARKPKIKRLWAFLYAFCECENVDEGVTAMGLYFKRIRTSAFLTGQSPNPSHPNWRANFDFLLREDVRTKLLEGGYK